MGAKIPQHIAIVSITCGAAAGEFIAVIQTDDRHWHECHFFIDPATSFITADETYDRLFCWTPYPRVIGPLIRKFSAGEKLSFPICIPQDQTTATVALAP